MGGGLLRGDSREDLNGRCPKVGRLPLFFLVFETWSLGAECGRTREENAKHVPVINRAELNQLPGCSIRHAGRKDNSQRLSERYRKSMACPSQLW